MIAGDELRTATSALSHARAILHAGRPVKALAILKRYVYEHPTSADAFVLAGEILLTLERLRDAEDSAEQALRLRPRYEPAIRLRARVLAAKGESRKARATLLYLLERDTQSVQNWTAASDVLTFLGDTAGATTARRKAQTLTLDARPKSLVEGDTNEVILPTTYADLHAGLPFAPAPSLAPEWDQFTPADRIEELAAAYEDEKPQMPRGRWLLTLLFEFALGIFFIGLALRDLAPQISTIATHVSMLLALVSLPSAIAAASPLKRLFIGAPIAGAILYFASRFTLGPDLLTLAEWQWKVGGVVAALYLFSCVLNLPKWIKTRFRHIPDKPDDVDDHRSGDSPYPNHQPNGANDPLPPLEPLRASA